MEVSIMIYHHIINHIKLRQKDPVMVAVLCQKINEKRATPNEKKTIQHLFQTIYHQLRDVDKQHVELTLVARNSDELLEWFLIQSYYHHVL